MQAGIDFTARCIAAKALESSGSAFEPTQTQLDAMNSGITSEDVTQIDTNKNNILLAEQANGAKNLLYVPSSVTGTEGGEAITWTADTNGYISTTSVTDRRAFAYANRQYTVHLEAGNYVFVVDIKTSTTNVSAVSLIINSSNSIVKSISLNDKTGVQTAIFTISSPDDYGVITKVFDGSWRLMIVPESLWDAGFTDYQPYAMSNAAITAWILAHS